MTRSAIELCAKIYIVLHIITFIIFTAKVIGMFA